MFATLTAILLLAPQAGDSPAQVETLDNGLRIVVVEDHTLPLLSVQLWVAAGSRDDPPEQRGLCQVVRTWVERRGDAAAKLRAAGVRFESATLRDASYFASVAPPGFLEYVLRIEAGRLRDAPLDAKSLTDAVHVAARARSVASDDNDERLFPAMFPKHPYERPPRFISRSVSDLTPREAQAFAERWFVGSNATLVVVGDVLALRVFEKAREQFANLPWRQRPTRHDVDPPPPARIERVLPRDDPDDVVQLAWLTPSLGSFRNAAIDVLMQRLCNDVDGPLARELEQAGFERPLFSHEQWRDAGVLTLDVRRKLGSTAVLAITPRSARDSPVQSAGSGGIAAQITRIVDAALTQAADSPPGAVELNRARALARREVNRRRASFGERALRFGGYELVAGSALLESYALPQIAAVASGDLRNAALELREARRVTLDSSGSRFAPTTNGSTPASAPAVAAPHRLSPAEAIDRMIAVAPRVPPVEPVETPTVSDVTIGPRLRLIVCRVPGAATVAVRTTLRADAAVLDMLDPIVRAGSIERDGAFIRDYCSYHSITAGSTLTRGRVGLSMVGPRDRWDAMLELQADLIRNPSIDRAAEVWDGPDSQTPGTGSVPQEIAADMLKDLLAEPDVTLIVVGDVEARAVRATVDTFWDRAAGGEAAQELERTAESRPAPRTRVGVFDLSESLDLPWLFVASAAPTARDARTRLAVETGLWFLAAPFPNVAPWEPDSVVWPLLRSSYDSLESSRAVTTPVEEQTKWLRNILTAIKRVRSGAIAPARLTRALHLARVRQLVRLDSVDAIADALQRGALDPWRIAPGLDAAACADVLRASFGDGPILFRAQHLNPALLAVLKEFGEVE